MSKEFIVAIVAGLVSLISVAATIWSSIANTKRAAANTRDIEQLRIENERLKAKEQREREISNYKEPLARSGYDLQSRIFNVLNLDLLDTYYKKGGERERSYVVIQYGLSSGSIFLLD